MTETGPHGDVLGGLGHREAMTLLATIVTLRFARTGPRLQSTR